jgi:hypothetical protein
VLSVIAGLVLLGGAWRLQSTRPAMREALITHRHLVVLLVGLACTVCVVVVTQRPRPSYLFAFTICIMALIGMSADLLAQRFRAAVNSAALLAGAAILVISELTGPTPPQAPPAPTEAVKRPRGRLRKVKPAAEQSAPPPDASEPTVDDNPPAPAPLQADASRAKIQKSELTISEPRRHRDKAHLKFVASQPCLVCGRSPADAHHLRFTQPRAIGRKVSDEFTVPLCRTHHRDNHRFGDEQAWWNRQAIDPLGTSRTLWVSTRRVQ